MRAQVRLALALFTGILKIGGWPRSPIFHSKGGPFFGTLRDHNGFSTGRSEGVGMTRADLVRVREWALVRLTRGNEPPWSWYQLMKLREAIDAIVAGMDATQPTADLPGSAPHSGRRLRLVGATDPQDSAQRHQDTVPVRLPT